MTSSLAQHTHNAVSQAVINYADLLQLFKVGKQRFYNKPTIGQSFEK